ncbi:MAG: aconitate hydratase AcnA [Sandaracinaceae bacterium]|nr:aconitate hydratase AcnA [Sandaracinaceae bacterium]
MQHPNSFDSLSSMNFGGRSYRYYRISALDKVASIHALPYSIRVLLENLLRREDGLNITKDHIEALARRDPSQVGQTEISFLPARVILQDFTGVPCIVDLASMRETFARWGGDPKRINPLQPVDLVIDHSVQVDFFGSPQAFEANMKLEFERNAERYRFLKWGQQAFQGLRVVPPGTGIIHQVHIEYLAQVVFARKADDGTWEAYPDTVFGTDSHTTMANGMGILGWGVGGIEAEAAMLGQPSAMLIPEVVGVELRGKLRPGVTATDLVLTITQLLRQKGVVGKFVEFFGEGLASLSVADRATIANMAPEYGATVGFFPIDQATLDYLRLTGRSEEHINFVEAYTKAQHLFWTPSSPTPRFDDVLTVDLDRITPSLAGPKRPQDRIPLDEMKASWSRTIASIPEEKRNRTARVTIDRNGCSSTFELSHGKVVIAAITSCTNTSNPSVMMGAGLLAKNAVERGLRTKPWVKTSLAPGSQVVTSYLCESGLLPYLEQLGFHLVGYGCTTCIGNSGPLEEPIREAITSNDLLVAAVLSGNRNFEGRISPEVKANYLASPPLVVAYAIAGRVDIDFDKEPLGEDPQGRPVFLRDIWPSPDVLDQAIATYVHQAAFRERYSDVFRGPEAWQRTEAPKGDLFEWDETSTYIAKAPFFDGLSPLPPPPPTDILGARVLALLGDSVTTDHISPAGSIKIESPAGRYLQSRGVKPRDFNQYGARRGHHEVMVRGTFANVRLRNRLLEGVEGGYTKYLGREASDGPTMAIYDAAERYRNEGIPLIVIAGKEYGTGSSRDWAAKGTYLLGVRAVIAESFERIHRQNLVGMGVLPLEFLPGENAERLGLSGLERYDITNISQGLAPRMLLEVVAHSHDQTKRFKVRARLDTPREVDYYRNGGLLQYVLRQMAQADGVAASSSSLSS